MANPASETGGVKPMAIAGRMVREQERRLGMSDAERAWRSQWLKDQILEHDEPRVPEGYYKERYNPLRRFYRAPLDKLEGALVKPLGEIPAALVRNLIGRTTLIMSVAWLGWYHFKYNRGDWTKKSTVKISSNRIAMYPNDPGYPNYQRPADDEFAAFGFKDSPI